MIGLDTNVLVRYLADDDRIQSPRAAKLIESFTAQSPGFISLAALLETVWVMQSLYESTNAEVSEITSQLLNTETLVVEQSNVVRLALQKFAKGKADFADFLIAAAGAQSGATETVTFDKRAARDAGMRLLGA